MSSEEKPDVMSEEESKQWLCDYRKLRSESAQRVRNLWKTYDEDGLLGEVGNASKKRLRRKPAIENRWKTNEGLIYHADGCEILSRRKYFLAINETFNEINVNLTDKYIINIIIDFLNLQNMFALQTKINNLQNKINSGELSRNSLMIHQFTLRSKLKKLDNIERGSDPGTPTSSSDSEGWPEDNPTSVPKTESSWIPQTPPTE